MGKNFVLNASYSHETRDGNKNTTFYGGPNYEVATPIDYTTDDFRFGGDYAKGRLFANVTADFSKFTNEVLYAEIDNPERLQLNNPNFPNGRGRSTTTSTFFRLWLPPDNKAYQVDFTAGYTLPARHKITGSLSTGQMKMDETLQNLSTNPDLGAAAAEPGLHDRPALRQHRGEVRHLHAQLPPHRRPAPRTSATSPPTASSSSRTRPRSTSS